MPDERSRFLSYRVFETQRTRSLDPSSAYGLCRDDTLYQDFPTVSSRARQRRREISLLSYKPYPHLRHPEFISGSIITLIHRIVTASRYRSP
jgi:hypothetical protein